MFPEAEGEFSQEVHGNAATRLQGALQHRLEGGF